MVMSPATVGTVLDLAVVSETYPPEINGVANTMRHLVEGLSGRGHRVRLVRPRQPADQPPAERQVLSTPFAETLVPGLPIPGYRGLRFGLPVYWRLRRLFHRTRPEVIYIATQGPLGQAALSAARGLRIPAVTGFHTHFEQYSRHYGLGLLNAPIANTLKRFHNRSDATLVPTAELKAQLEDSGFHNVEVFGRGVDVDLFSPARRDPALRVAWGCARDDLAVLYVGRMAVEKNLALALDAFRAIAAARPGARLVLVGDGPALQGIQRDHPDYVCTGARVGEDLAAHYASGDLFLFPSVTETYGNVVPEAMASGLPLVAFDYAAARAAIDSGTNGITVPVHAPETFIAAALTLVREPERLRRLGQAARRRAEAMSWDRVLGVVEGRLIDVVRARRALEASSESMATQSDRA